MCNFLECSAVIDFDDIAMDAAAALRPLLQRAYDAGRLAGRQEMYEEVQNRLGSLLSPLSPDAVPVRGLSGEDGNQVSDSGRAPPGTVKPLIEKIVGEHPEGLTMDDVEAISGVKPNSVRGTLYALRNDRILVKRGNLWFHVSQTNEAPQGGTPGSASKPEDASGVFD